MLEMPSRLGEEKEIYVALLWNDSQRMGRLEVLYSLADSV